MSYSKYRRGRVLKSFERIIQKRDLPERISIVDSMNRELISKYLFNPNSPWFNEELYWHYIKLPDYILEDN